MRKDEKRAIFRSTQPNMDLMAKNATRCKDYSNF